MVYAIRLISSFELGNDAIPEISRLSGGARNWALPHTHTQSRDYKPIVTTETSIPEPRSNKKGRPESEELLPEARKPPNDYTKEPDPVVAKQTRHIKLLEKAAQSNLGDNDISCVWLPFTLRLPYLIILFLVALTLAVTITSPNSLFSTQLWTGKGRWTRQDTCGLALVYWRLCMRARGC